MVRCAFSTPSSLCRDLVCAALTAGFFLAASVQYRFVQYRFVEYRSVLNTDMGAKQSRGGKSNAKVGVDSGAGTALGRCIVGADHGGGDVTKRQSRRVTFTSKSPEVRWIPRQRPTGERDRDRDERDDVAGV